MKKILFCIFVLFYVIGFDTAMCQHAVVQTNYPNDVERTIVREYNYPATVSYVETSVKHYFAYADASMTVTNCEISHDISVTDMELHGQFAYFCGYNTVSGVGVWGWFDVNTLISGALNYYTYDNFSCNVLYADSLFSLAVYEELGLLHIATVGSTTDGAGKKYACLIDITGTEGTVAGWNYEMGTTYCLDDDNFNYRAVSICVTDNYIVTAGPSLNISINECYKVHRRSNVFLSGGPQDRTHCFTDYTHRGHDMALAHIDNDNVASATYWYNYPGTLNGVIVNVFDAANLAATPFGTIPTYTMQAQVPSPAFRIKDLIYSRTKSELVLLLSEITSLSNGSIIAELPIPPSYVVPIDVTYTSSYSLSSLDGYNSDINFLAMGYDISNPSYATFFTQPLQMLPKCANNYSTYIYAPFLAAKSRVCPYTVCSGTFKCVQANSKAFKKDIDTICIEP